MGVTGMLAEFMGVEDTPENRAQLSRHHSARPVVAARRHRRGRAVPCLGRGGVHHRRRAAGRRRPHGVSRFDRPSSPWCKSRVAPRRAMRRGPQRGSRVGDRPAAKARRARIPPVFERGATQAPGMQRASNAARLAPRVARPPGALMPARTRAARAVPPCAGTPGRDAAAVTGRRPPRDSRFSGASTSRS